jgi:hypothetical protein
VKQVELPFLEGPTATWSTTLDGAKAQVPCDVAKSECMESKVNAFQSASGHKVGNKVLETVTYNSNNNLKAPQNLIK